MALLLVAGCSSSKKSEKQVHIGILQYVEHESLTAARKGFENELKDQGYIDGKNIKIDKITVWDSGNTENANLELNLKNSIVYGKKENSISFEPVSGYNFSYLISHSLIKYSNKAGYNFDTNPQIINSIKNENPLFLLEIGDIFL